MIEDISVKNLVVWVSWSTIYLIARWEYLITNLVPRVVLEQPWLSQMIPRFWLVDNFLYWTPTPPQQTKHCKIFFGWWRNVFWSCWPVAPQPATIQPWIIHVNNPSFSQDLFEVVSDPQSKASTSLSAAAFACVVQLYSYGSVWN